MPGSGRNGYRQGVTVPLDSYSYPPGLEPACEVLLEREDGELWCEGCVRVWRRYEDGWYACVHYTTADAHHLATFPGKNVRNTIPPW